MFVLDKPLVPKYSKLSVSSVSSATSGISSASSNLSSLKSVNTVTTVITNGPLKANGQTISRVNSAASLGRPYQTDTDEPFNQRRKSRSAPEKPSKAVVTHNTTSSSKKSSKQKGRQYSADSGVETSPNYSAFPSSEQLNGDIDSPFELPPRITTYAESECYLMNLPRCDQFATHLARNLKPMINDIQFTPKVKAKDVIKTFANKLHRLAQESVIAFPRSASTVNNSPRFQEFLRIAVEK